MSVFYFKQKDRDTDPTSAFDLDNQDEEEFGADGQQNSSECLNMKCIKVEEIEIDDTFEWNAISTNEDATSKQQLRLDLMSSSTIDKEETLREDIPVDYILQVYDYSRGECSSDEAIAVKEDPEIEVDDIDTLHWIPASNATEMHPNLLSDIITVDSSSDDDTVTVIEECIKKENAIDVDDAPSLYFPLQQEPIEYNPHWRTDSASEYEITNYVNCIKEEEDIEINDAFDLDGATPAADDGVDCSSEDTFMASLAECVRFGVDQSEMDTVIDNGIPCKFPLLCAECGKEFYDKGKLQRHLTHHFREKPKKSFKCTDCPMLFKCRSEWI